MRLATFTKLLVFFAVVGIFGYDGFALVANQAHTESNAQDAAYAASQAWHNNPNLTVAYEAAQASLAGTGDTVLQTNFTVDPDGTIHLEVQHTAKTLVFKSIGPLKKYTVTIQHGDANSVN